MTNMLMVDKRDGEEFLRDSLFKDHIPSLSYMYESDSSYVGVSVSDNTISRKRFNEELDCVQWLEEQYGSRLSENSNSLPPLREWLTIKDMMATNNVSDETQKHGYRRYRLQRGENINAKLKDCVYDPMHDTLTFSFLTPATMGDHEPGYTADAVDPTHDFQTVSNPSHTYTMMIQIVDFMMWLKDTRPDGLGAITWREIKDVLDVAYVKVWCNCQSFYWFGKCYRASLKDASIYTTSIPDRKTRKRFGVDDILCKHLGNLMKPQAIQFFLPQMASKCQKALRSQGLI